MKILLALDLSAASQAVVKAVSLRPWPAGTSVEVCTVVDAPQLWALGEAIEELTKRSQELVDSAARCIAAEGLKTTPLVLAGHPKIAIADRATETQADFVFVGSHGTGDVALFLVGSVARAMVRFAPCSVEVVRVPAVPEESPRGLRILFAADGSESSGAAARSISGRPWPAGTKVRVLNIVEPHLNAYEASFSPIMVPETDMAAARAQAMMHSEQAVAEAERLLAPAGLEVSESISVLLDKPEHIILEEAKTWMADLIVLGSHGRRGLDRFLLGSVAEAVAMHAACSVEVIR